MSQEKGKILDHLESQLTLKNHNPGCMWGILHHFQHNRWHNVVKKLPRKRLIGHGKHSTDQGRNRAKTSTSTSTTPESANTQENPQQQSPDAGKMQENDDISSIESPLVIVPSASAHKSSMKSRIKALISDEKRRKGRHKRSSTYPIKKPVDEPVQALEKTESPPPPLTQSSSNDELCTSSSPRDHNVGPTPASLAKMSEENSRNGVGSCELCDTMLKVNYLKQNELGKQPVRDHTLLYGNSIYAVEPSKCDAIQESKLFMDALDLLNVREEVFLKILQDPTSSLANNQLQFRQSPNLRLGLNKSVSFAVTGKRDYTSSEKEEEAKEEEGCCVGKNGDSDEVLVKKNVGIKGFKNIGARIKHVIRDKKKEKNRIIKDAVHDKIPCDRNVSKNDAQIVTDFGRSSKKSFKRTTSFSDSFDRYNQLLEISINRDAKDHISDRLRFKTGKVDKEPPRPAKLGRIFSLPDLRSYSSTQIEDSSPLVALDTTEQKLIGLGSHGEKQEKLLDVGEDFDELVILKNSESDSSSVLNLEHVLVSAPPSSSLDEISESDLSSVLNLEHVLVSAPPSSNLDEISEGEEFVHEIEVCEDSNSSPAQQDLSCSEQDMIDIDTQESEIEQFYEDLMHMHKVDSKNLAEYNYVRDVLELSGFSRDAFLGKWQSTEHVLNPSVFQQVEGCLVDKSECEQVYTNNDHALLFDMINEVLLGIHERSFCYWPRSLTSLSRLHRLPKGNRVLEEVWTEIRWLLSWCPEGDQAIDEAVSRDMSKDDGWMNLQLDAECVGLKLEDMIFDDLVDEIIAE